MNNYVNIPKFGSVELIPNGQMGIDINEMFSSYFPLYPGIESGLLGDIDSFLQDQVGIESHEEFVHENLSKTIAPKVSQPVNLTTSLFAKGHSQGDRKKKAVESQQAIERKARNREHAKQSRIRKQVLLSTLQDQYTELRKLNANLRRIISDNLPPDTASKILYSCTTPASGLLSKNDSVTTLSLHPSESEKTSSGIVQQPSVKMIMEADFRLIQALQHAQQNFVLSDPTLPDNPIIYCSDGFCKLTKYKRQDILGRNCRFLQGPDTDQTAIDVIRKGMANKEDVSVCLLNYKADGTPFWNQFFIAALQDNNGIVTNFVGVQCEVNSVSVESLKKRVKKMPLLCS